MPDLPPAKRKIPAVRARGTRARTHGVRYAELHCRTNFSFLRGASHPDELVNRAAELGLAAIAITDRNSLAGIVRAHVAAREVGVKLLVGAEITPDDAANLVLLATSRSGYANLSQLVTHGRRNAGKGDFRLRFEDLAGHADGLLACVITNEAGPDRHRLQRGEAGSGIACDELARYRELFGDRCFAVFEAHYGPNDAARLTATEAIANRCRTPLVLANDVHYHIPERRRLQDVLTAIRAGRPINELGGELFANGERYLKSAAQMERCFAQRSDLIDRTAEIADCCCFSLDELRYEYPEGLSPAGMSPIRHLTRLCFDGARRRYPRGIPDKVRELLEHELRLIEELRFESYFLTVWDLVRFARSRNILCQGRGSAANSAVCFCLGVTSVDPERINVLFERFVSRERDEAPDIDVDFEHERREEVIQYIYGKYGRDRAGMTAEVITYRVRSAVRDVGKALGLSLDRVDALARSLDHSGEPKTLEDQFRETGFDPDSPPVRQLAELVREIAGFPRHLSQHVGGMVITQGRLSELVPIENASMPDRTVIEWDKDDLDALGILKVDCLALGMLTAIHKCFELIAAHHGRVLDLADIPHEDAAVYEMISRADTMGVFQIESRGQMSMLRRLRPYTFYDLVIEVALLRPGPIQGDMVHPYLRRRNGEEPFEYPNEQVRSVLHRTLGVPIFQEQAMRLAIVAAGFTPGEADQLRRAMGAWRRPGIIDQFQRKLVEGLLANGYSAEYADRLFRQIRGFGEYGFPESHAASFALLAWVSAWLKHYYPAAFTAALLNSQPMGFYAPAQLVRDARDHGVEVRPVDVNFSDWDCTLEPASAGPGPTRHEAARGLGPALRLGFRLVSGLARRHVEGIIAARGVGEFRTFDDFTRRTRFSNSVLTTLTRADVFGSNDLRRRPALWAALPLQKTLPLFGAIDSKDEAPRLPAMTAHEEVLADYRSSGLSLKGHPMSVLRPELDRRGVVPADQLVRMPADRKLRVAGLVLLRQRPSTARGITFVTLEDESGIANLVVRPDVWERFRNVARGSNAVLARGMLQREGDVIHVVVDRLDDLSELLPSVHLRSRDFR